MELKEILSKLKDLVRKDIWAETSQGEGFLEIDSSPDGDWVRFEGIEELIKEIENSLK